MQLHAAEINIIMMLLEENLMPQRALSILQLIVNKFDQDPTATNLDITRIGGLLDSVI